MGWSDTFIICFHLTRAPPVLSGKVASSFEEIDQSSNFKSQSIKTTAKQFLSKKLRQKFLKFHMSQICPNWRIIGILRMFSCERDMFSHCVILIIIVMMMMMMFCVIIIQAAGRSNSGSTRSWILCNSFCNSSPTSPESSSTSSSSPSSWLQQQQHRFYQLHHNYSLSPGDGPSLKN